MAKGKSVKYKVVSLETGIETMHLRMNPASFDKAKRYKKYDKQLRKHVECKVVPIKKGGTKALQNSKKEGE